MSETVNYIDILKPRNTQFGIFKFMTRKWEPKKTVTLEKYYLPQEIKKVVAESVYIDAYVEAESARSGTSKEQLRKEVYRYLEEIAMDKKMHTIRWMGILFLKICFMMKVGVFVNEPALLKIKSSMGKNPILFLPTHRSYADFCLMTYLCFHYEIELPAVAAGMDFYSMAVIGQSMRETGAFYIRRTLVGSSLYAATLRHYARTLVAKHYAPVEFFLEGTRSRSNMSLPPKYGMLSMTLVPYFAREVDDITIVPINISYDRLMEQSLFAYEHIGVPKPKETTGGLLKSLYRLNDHYGNIYINFGEPISIREYFRKDLGPSSETLKPLDLQQLTTEQFEQVQDIADYTVSMQQKNTVVTISNLICITLMESIMKNEVMSLEQVLIKIEWLIKIFRSLGASVFENDVKSSVDRILLVHKKIMKLDGHNKLRLVSGTLMDVSPEVQKKMKGHILKAETMVNAIPVIELQLYVNPVLHYLVPPAIVYLAVLRGENTIEGLSDVYNRLRTLLRHEFFHLEKNEGTTFNKALEYCVQNKVITDTYRNGSEESLQLLLQWTVTPALTTLANCVEVMVEHRECEQRAALRLLQQRAEARRRHPYCLSLEAAAAALQGLVLAGALAKRREQQQVMYQAVPGKLEACSQLLHSVLSNISIVFNNVNSVIISQDLKAKL